MTTKEENWQEFWENIGPLNYKGYDLKYSLLVPCYIIAREKSSLYRKVVSLIKIKIKAILSWMKWLSISRLTSKESKSYILYFKSEGEMLENMNAYAINFLPSDPRHFLHISRLAEEDINSIVFTTKRKVCDYFVHKGKPVVYFGSWGKYLQPDHKAKKLGFRERFIYSRSVRLIEKLEDLEKRLGYPKTLVTLQDFHSEDSIFTSFFKKKVPTVTLQHGMVNPGGLWQFVLSDYIICWGKKSAENLRKSGIPDEKIIPLGTAKYDQYLLSSKEREKKNNRFVVQIGVQQGSVLGEEYEQKTYEFFKEFIYDHPEYDYLLKFHPAKKKREIKKYRKLADMSNVRISNSNNAYELISESDVVLTYRTTLATDAMILDRPVIEYQLLSGDQSEEPFGDYRDNVIRISDHTSLEQELRYLASDKQYRDIIIAKQREFLREEMFLPPSTKRILDFVNSLSLGKE